MGLAPISASNPDYGTGRGRRGSFETRRHIDKVRDEFLDKNPMYDHVYGGTDALTGLKMKEEWLKPHGKNGGSYADLTFQHRVTGERVRVQTVDLDAKGVVTQREIDNAIRIHKQDLAQGGHGRVILVPKPGMGGMGRVDLRV